MKQRTCSKCEDVLDLTPENFNRDRRDKEGFQYRCKKCLTEYQRRWYAARKAKKKTDPNACVVCGGDKGVNYKRCNNCLNSPVPYDIPITGADIVYLSEQNVSC